MICVYTRPECSKKIKALRSINEHDDAFELLLGKTAKAPELSMTMTSKPKNKASPTHCTAACDPLAPF